MTGTSIPGNKREDWEWRFRSGDWEGLGGPGLTRAFAQAIIHHLPEETLRWLSVRNRRILDWGCATGELVDEWSQVFPMGVLRGLDFSMAAVDIANERYGGRFFWDPKGSVPGRWDCIVTSNTLEHLLDFEQRMFEHFEVCDRYILLVPFDEGLGYDEQGGEKPGDRDRMTPEERADRGHVHVQKFQLADFPLNIGPMWRIHEDARVQVPEWDEEQTQLLVVYARDAE